MNDPRSSILERLKRIKTQLSPEEKQLLKIDDEDLRSFAPEGESISPEGVKETVKDIIEDAYKESPAFKEYVEQDQETAPGRFPRSGRVVGKFLRHLRGMLPPESVAWIQRDVTDQVEELMQGAVRDVSPQSQPSAREPKPLAPLSSEELSMFGLSADDLRPGISQSDVVKPIMWFLDKLKEKDSEGKIIHNEATKNMPDHLREDILLRFLAQIRRMKLRTKGELKDWEKKWLGKDKEQLERIVSSLVEPPKQRERGKGTMGIRDVKEDIQSLVLMVHRLIESMQSRELSSDLDEIRDLLEGALPPVDELQEKLQRIQEEVNKLGLSRTDINKLLEVDVVSLMHTPVDFKERFEELRSSLSKLMRQKEEKGADQELSNKVQTIKNQVEALKTLRSKDTSALYEAVEDYLEFLRSYEEKVESNLNRKKMEELSALDEFISRGEQLVKAFNKAKTQDRFTGLWKGRGRAIFRSAGAQEAGAQEAGTFHRSRYRLTTASSLKTAAFAESYSDKVSKFRARGLQEVLEELKEMIGSEEEMIALRNKLLSMTDAPPHTRLNPSDVDYRGNPLGGKGLELGGAEKMLSNFRNKLQKIGLAKKRESAKDILQWAADLTTYLKAGRRQRKKKASVFDLLKQAASFILKQAAEGETETEKRGPVRGIGREKKAPPESEAGPIVYRERLTTQGRKQLRDFFHDTPFVGEFVEAMEMEGLGEMVQKGGDVEQLKERVDPIIEKVLKKATGKEGDFKNILHSLAIQEKNVKRDMEKAKKEWLEANERVRKLNNKLVETEKKYLPRLEAFARFLMHPREAIKQRLQEKREIKVKGPSPVDKSNYQDILTGLFNRYSREKSASAPRRVGGRSRAAGLTVDVVRELIRSKTREISSCGERTAAETFTFPSQKYKELLSARLELKALEKASKEKKKPVEKAKKVRDFIQRYLDLVAKTERYVKGIGDKVLSNDYQQLSNLKKFLSSEKAKDLSEEDLKRAKNMVSTIELGLDREQRSLRVLKDALEAQKKQIEKSKAGDRLSEIERDLEDNKVDRIYEVAMSPEMNPSPERLKAIKKEEKGKQKGISYLMDRNRYKKEMNKIMTLYGKGRPAGPVTEYKGKGVEQILPSDRLEQLRKQIQEAKEKSGELPSDSQDPDVRSRRRAFLEDQLRNWKVEQEKTEEYLEQAKKDLEAHEEVLKDLWKATQQRHKEKEVTEEEQKENRKKIHFLMQKIGDEQRKVENLEDHLEYRKDQIERYRKEYEKLPVKEEKVIPELARLQELQKKIEPLKGKFDPEKTRELIKGLRGLEERLKERGIEDINPVSHRIITNMFEAGLEKDIEEIQKSDWITPQEKTELSKLEKEMEELRKKLRGQAVKTAAIAEDVPHSPVDIALTEKGTPPADYMKDLPKPKDWDVVENFFTESRKELETLEKMKDKDWDKIPEEQQRIIGKRIKELEGIIPKIEEYRNQLIDFQGEKTPFRDTVVRFDELVDKYLDELRKYNNQRDDASKRLLKAEQEYRFLQSLFDPDTGEYKGLSDEEIEDLKDIFFRELYKYLDAYWSTRIGKRINVFGERDTAWYNNVFYSFKNLSGVKSNKKLMSAITRLKQETRSDIDDLANRLKSQELEKRRDELVKKVKELGGDPSRSEAIEELNTRIKTLKAQEKRLDKLFKEMSQAVAVHVDEHLNEALKEKIPTKKPETKTDFEEEKKEQIEDVATILEDELGALIDAEKTREETERIISRGEAKVGIKSPESEESGTKEKPEQEEKQASYGMDHPDFNSRILYGPLMQKTIQDMIEKGIAK